jgi:hypothetical protein
VVEACTACAGNSGEVTLSTQNQKHQTHPDPSRLTRSHKLRIGVDSTKPTWFSSVRLSNFRHGSERLFRESRGCTSILQTAKPNHRSERKQRWTGCLECFAALNLALSSLPLFCAFWNQLCTSLLLPVGSLLPAQRWNNDIQRPHLQLELIRNANIG